MEHCWTHQTKISSHVFSMFSNGFHLVRMWLVFFRADTK